MMYKVNNLFKRNSHILIRVLTSCALSVLFVLSVAAQTPTTQSTPPPQPQPLPSPQQLPQQQNTTPVPNASPAPGTTTTQQQTAPPPANNDVRQQPQPGQTQTQPNAPAGQAPGTTNPVGAGQSTAPATGTQQTAPSAAGQNVGTTGVAPAELPLPPPPIEPNFEAPNRPLPSADRVGVDVTNQTPLSLNDAITMALENNNSIETSRIDVQLSEFDLRAARGVFDPRLVSQSFFQRSVVPTASTLGSSTGSTTSTSFNANAGLNGFAPIGGGTYQATFNSARQTTNAPFTSLNPQFPTSLTLSFTQPLLRGRRIDDNRRRIQIAKKNLSLTDAQFRQQTINVITSVVQAYWDLTFSLRNLQVQIDAVKQARAQVESNRRLVEQGILAPIDIVAADTQVTNFEQNVYAAQEQVTRAESNLKTLLAPNANTPIWAQAIIPTTPVNVEPPRVSFEDALSTALTTRTELDLLRTNREINEINTRFFRDQTKPQVDLVASYTGAGLAGSQVSTGSNPLTSSFGPIIERVNTLSANAGLPPLQLQQTNSSAIPGNLVGGYGQSLQNIIGFNYPTFQVGVRVDLPIGNRTARANLGRSLAEGTRIDTQTAATVQQIKAQVQTSLQTLRSAEARLASAAASRSSSEQLYASEQRRFENGTSTVFLVLQRQQELVAARGRELQAQTDLNKAIADFQRSTGNTFQAHNIMLRDNDNHARQYQINEPSSAGSDGVGFTPSSPRVTPAITNTVQANSYNDQP